MPGGIQTRSGKWFFPLDPRPEDVDITDIAWALSMKCRFNGHTRFHYCVPPDSLVLTLDLKWVPAGSLVLGQPLLSIEEERPGKRRRSQIAKVTHTGRKMANIVRLDLEDGTSLRSSTEHPWLVATKLAGNQAWDTAANLLDASRRGRSRCLLRYVQPWRQDMSRQAGYMAGLLDGEGSVSGRSGGFPGIQFAQNPGRVLDAYLSGMEELGFRFTLSDNAKTSHVVSVSSLGDWGAKAAMLGILRPERLIDNVCRYFESGFQPELRAAERLRVIGGEMEGQGEVVALSTSSRTYFADGFAAHNSVAQHSVLVAESFDPKSELALAGLLHDAGEYVLPDIAAPIKHAFPDICDVEDRVLRAVFAGLGVPWPSDDVWDDVKSVDSRIVYDEMGQLMEWTVKDKPTMGLQIFPLSQEAAYHAFLETYRLIRE